MRIISLVLISFLIIFTINANEEKIKVPKDFQQLQEKLNEQKSTTANVSNNSDWFQKIRPFIVPLLIVLYLIFKSDNAEKSKSRRKKNNQSEIDEFIEKSNEKENEFVENNEISNLTIKVEEQTSLENNIPSYYVMAFGLLNFSTQRAAIIPISPSGIFISLIINIFELSFLSFLISKLSKIFFSISFLFKFN